MEQANPLTNILWHKPSQFPVAGPLLLFPKEISLWALFPIISWTRACWFLAALPRWMHLRLCFGSLMPWGVFSTGLGAPDGKEGLPPSVLNAPHVLLRIPCPLMPPDLHRWTPCVSSASVWPSWPGACGHLPSMSRPYELSPPFERSSSLK